MSIIQHHIEVTRTAHYYTHGTLDKKTTKHIWFVFHGYGQQAERVVQKFDFLSEEEHFVIAPEGLSRFYWHKGNKPVASWMTSKDRYHEINDFVQFINRLYSLYCLHVSQEVKIHLFGFSQGCATLWRWVHASQPRLDTIINWGGWIPEDISYRHLKAHLAQADLYMHYGTEDQFINADMVSNLKILVTDNQLDVAFSSFAGEHRIPQEELEAFCNAKKLI